MCLHRDTRDCRLVVLESCCGVKLRTSNHRNNGEREFWRNWFGDDYLLVRFMYVFWVVYHCGIIIYIIHELASSNIGLGVYMELIAYRPSSVGWNGVC